MSETLKQLIAEIYRRVEQDLTLTGRELVRLQRRFVKDSTAAQPFYTKAEILAAVIHDQRWSDLSADRRRQLRASLQVKPVRTQSGVATVTILTKPWPCPGGCVFCPSDARMPKSYLANEPGAQRAEANFFDPYLQVYHRLQTLASMGHSLAKVEIIVLGGTWDAYPRGYQRWFIREVFQALNDFGTGVDRTPARVSFYQDLDETWAGRELVLSNRAAENARRVQPWQAQLNAGQLTYNQLVVSQYLSSQREKILADRQIATWVELAHQQELNSHGACRNVGLVIETRPDQITETNLRAYRRLGCTKIQVGVQSLDEEILWRNGRAVTRLQIAQALARLRLFGFKIHVHFMANLLGSTPQKDSRDFKTLVSQPEFLPDEIKLYPCALLRGSELYHYYQRGQWQPYTHEQLLDLLVADMQVCPPYVRVSRMIRDFSAQDIVAGNKKTNFRQLVDQRLQQLGLHSQDIRSREIKTTVIDPQTLSVEVITYQTSVSTEYFLQSVTPLGRIAGFLRLSLPDLSRVEEFLPDWQDDWELVSAESAMIREVHVYGTVASLGQRSGTAQHWGLGKRLIAQALEIARAHKRRVVRVISAVGTREYYAKLGFKPAGEYQCLELDP